MESTPTTTQQHSCTLLPVPSTSSPCVSDIDIQIARSEKVADYLARAIEHDMSYEPSYHPCSDDEQLADNATKRRKWPVRHRSNEMGNGGGNGDGVRKTPFRNSNSFAGYDYRGQALCSKERFERDGAENEVMRKVELYEGLKKQ